MRTRFLCLMLGLAMLLTLGSFTIAAEDLEADTQEAVPYFLIDGVAYEDPGLMVYENITYVSLANIVLALHPEAVFTWEGDVCVVTTDELVIRLRVGDQYIEANGRYLYTCYGVQGIDGRVLVSVRTIATALNAGVGWIEETGEIEIYPSEGVITSGDEFYDADAVYWLSRIINAESGNQPLDGKLAVGTVIMNRVESSRFPDNIYDVIFAPNQFTPTRNGAIYNEPNAESVVAAKLVLEGVRVGGDSLYFVNPNTSPNSWAERNRPHITTIGAHAFFG